MSFLDSDAFKKQTACAFLMALALDSERRCVNCQPITKEEAHQKVLDFVKMYAIPLHFRKAYFRKFATTNINLRKPGNCNYIWDEYILYCVGQKIGNEEIVLVTSDKAMFDAAKEVCPTVSVMKMEEYARFINVNLRRRKLKSRFIFALKKIKKRIAHLLEKINN